MLNGLMNIGQSALNASQAWISVTGNNLANADTEGYSRQYVDQKDAGGLTYRPGAQPLGVNAQQIMRFFDAFLERSYIRQNANSSRWDQQDTIMASVENIFNESNRKGISSSMNSFFNAWQDLALRPDDTSVRQSLLSFADNMGDMFKNTMGAIKDIQNEMNVSIRQGVDRVNELAAAIADINKQITALTVDGVSNPNSLLDKRDQLVREMSTYVDVETIDHGKGNFRVQLSTGQPLVDGHEKYSLSVEAAKSESHILAGSSYKGNVQFDGTGTHEYTVEIMQGGDATGTPGDAANPTFRVSLDGGKTWLKDSDGKEARYDITYKTNANGQFVDKDGRPVDDNGYLIDEGGFLIDKDGKQILDSANKPISSASCTVQDGKLIYNGSEIADAVKSSPATNEVLVKDLKISFTSINDFSKGDRFYITPKDHLCWVEPTRGPQNITPQIGFDGVDNPNRLTGGKLAAYFNIRDDNCGRYMDELDAVANAVIWEVNRIHSQGAGLDKYSFAQGQQRVENVNVPLGTHQSMLPYFDRMDKGSFTIHFYDKTSGDYQGSATIDFDPKKDSLAKLAEKIQDAKVLDANGNEAKGSDGNLIKLSASIQDGKLQLTSANENAEFAMGADSSGVMAALGINSFFAGSNAEDMAVNSQIHSNTQFIAAGQVNGQFEINKGDNSIANAIGQLVDKPVTITTMWKTDDTQSLTQYYANLVTTVGADRRLSKTNTEYHGALTNDLYERVTSVTGVNMDEEMTNLIKFQHSYTAAAKLITTADQMLQTLLGLKQ